VRFLGNYVRNAGTVAMGNIRSRAAHLEVLGSGQHIIADNVFESGVCYGGCAIRAAAGANQVVIRNNLFVNYATSAIEVTGACSPRDLPARTATITGNILDMTALADKPRGRTAIRVSTHDTIVANNQIYVRGATDPTVTAIQIREPATNVAVHGNLVRNCGAGIAASRCYGLVGEVVDKTTFLRAAGPGHVALERRDSHRYRGWNLAWLSRGKPSALSVIEAFDPESLRFGLAAPHDMKVGDRFEVFPPHSANWNIHDNTVTGCARPVVLDAYGSDTSLFRGNTITRGGAEGVKEAIVVAGRFALIRNHVAGFDEPGAAALVLQPDRLGRPCRNLYRGNVFERCACPIREARKGLWEASVTDGNQFLDCDNTPKAQAKP